MIMWVLVLMIEHTFSRLLCRKSIIEELEEDDQIEFGSLTYDQEQPSIFGPPEEKS